MPVTPTKVLLTSDSKIRNPYEDGSGEYQTLSEELATFSPERMRVARETHFELAVSFAQLPEKPIQTADVGETTPSVLNVERLKLTSTSPTTVTDLLYGQEGQGVVILGDGQTTMTHGSLMKTNTGANKLMASNRCYSFYRFNGVWYEA